MAKNWKWPVIIIGVFAVLAYWTFTTDYVLVLDSLHFGRPDPSILIVFGILISASSSWYMFRMWQEGSKEIVTNVGGFCVHNLDPQFKFDPLDYYENVNAEVLAVRNKEILVSKQFEDYNQAVDALRLMGCWCDGGVDVIGIDGPRLGGNAYLVLPLNFFKKYGNIGISLAWVKEYYSIEQLYDLPPHIAKAVYDNIPQFVPGRDIIVYGTEPLEQTVRAYNEITTEWGWTLGFQNMPIDVDKRREWLNEEVENVRAEANVLRDQLGFHTDLDKDPPHENGETERQHERRDDGE